MKLKKNSNFNDNAKFLIVVLDGVGFSDEKNNINLNLNQIKNSLPSAPFWRGNAVNAAYTPHLAELYASKHFRTLNAHGKAVGLPSDEDMGNSEVGHNALGSGQIFAQGAKLVNAAFENGELFKGKSWQLCVNREQLKNGTNCLHLCGLLSDGNVHSHINHLFALISGAKKFGVKKVRLHLLLDGRDVSPLSSLIYVQQLNEFLSQQNDDQFHCLVASGGGRTFVTMDRYESDWSVVERGYNAHVLGEARFFSSIENAIETYRKEGNYYDQDLPAFVIANNEIPVGRVEENDSFIFFNFRGDRAIEITRALTEKNFNHFERKIFPKIYFAGMMQYDGDLHLPENFLVTPPLIQNTMTELLIAENIKQFACSETQKFGHVTYFWNGNRSEKFSPELENYIEIPSDKVNFAEKPWMKCAEITDTTIAQMKSNNFKIGRINFANGDMVGHTGNFAASVVALGATDLCLGRLMQAAKETNTVLFVTADHGNADEMFELDKKKNEVNLDSQGNPKPKTSHTLAPVPFAIYNSDFLPYSIELKKNIPHAGLANIAATVLEMAGFDAPSLYETSLIQFNQNSSKEKINVQSLLSLNRNKKSLPTLNFSTEISKTARQLGFCWSTLKEVFHDLECEVEELKKEIESQECDYIKISDEMGDIVFCLSNLVDFLNADKNKHMLLDLDIIAQESVEKFIHRFEEMEKICQESGSPLTKDFAQKLSLTKWMELWNTAKKRRYR